MEQGITKMVQTILEKVAESSADSASNIFLYEPELPECLKKEIEEQ